MKKQIKIFISSITISFIIGLIISFFIWQSYQKPEHAIWGATMNPIKIAKLLYFITIPIFVTTGFLLFKSIKSNKIYLSLVGSLALGFYWVCLVLLSNAQFILD